MRAVRGRTSFRRALVVRGEEGGVWVSGGEFLAGRLVDQSLAMALLPVGAQGGKIQAALARQAWV